MKSIQKINIFATHPVGSEAARDLDNLRLCKMVTETAQIISTVYRTRFNLQPHYKTTHKNHPCTVWARNSTGNLSWLIEYGNDLHKEFIFRRGKTHKAGLVISDLATVFVNELDLGEPMTPFANCARRKDLNLDFTHLPVHEAYRAYLNARWTLDKRPPKWGNRWPPTWVDFTWTGPNEKVL